jgi:hypothetical protein
LNVEKDSAAATGKITKPETNTVMEAFSELTLGNNIRAGPNGWFVELTIFISVQDWQ